KLTNQTGPEGQEQPSEPAGPADAPATPPIAAPRPAPAVVDASTFPAALLADLQGHYERQAPRGTWRILTGRLAAGRHAPIEWSSMIDGARALGRGEPGGEALSRRLVDHFEGRRRGERETLGELDALLAAAEAWPLYDDAFAGYVWLQAMQAGGEPGELAALVARIE